MYVNSFINNGFNQLYLAYLANGQEILMFNGPPLSEYAWISLLSIEYTIYLLVYIQYLDAGRTLKVRVQPSCVHYNLHDCLFYKYAGVDPGGAQGATAPPLQKIVQKDQDTQQPH